MKFKLSTRTAMADSALIQLGLKVLFNTSNASIKNLRVTRVEKNSKATCEKFRVLLVLVPD